tara:strand:+ start:925 stop:1500 length:576 start_codon:yes stop_codon:yes gene_type:complete
VSLLKRIFGKKNKSTSDESDILSAILRVENPVSPKGTIKITLSAKSALLLNTNDDSFFQNVDASLKKILIEQQPITSKVTTIESNEYNSCWVLFENTVTNKMIDDINSVSSKIANLGLSNNMTAAIFKGVVENNPTYWVCNYRTAKFYPLVPTENDIRDNDMEIKIGEVLALHGIPIEPHMNWYSLSDIPF